MSHENVIHHLHVRAQSFRESADVYRATGDLDLAERCDDEADECIYAMRHLASDVRSSATSDPADRPVSDTSTAAASDVLPATTIWIPPDEEEPGDEMLDQLVTSARADGVDYGYNFGKRIGQSLVLGMTWKERRQLRRELDAAAAQHWREPVQEAPL